MNSYHYKAKDVSGKVHTGTVECTTEMEFYRALEEKGLYCVSVRTKDQAAGMGGDSIRFTAKETAVFCREFSVMLSAGMNMLSALQLLYERADKKKQKTCYMQLIEGIEKGDTLYDSMRKLKKTFPGLLLAMVLAGESSGAIDSVMGKMATYYEKEADLKAKMQNAMIYPSILIVITVGVVILLFAFVLPQFFDLFEGREVPGITRFFMGISYFLTNWWFLLLGGVAALIILVRVLKRSEKFELRWDEFKLKIPVIGKLLEKLLVSHFANAMNILYSSGITIVQALQISVGTVENAWVTRTLMRVTEMVEKGVALSEAMQKEKLFDTMIWSMLHVGEESGSLETMFLKLSEYYSQEAEAATQKLMAILEPAVLIVIAVVIAMVVASVLLPIYSMYQIG